MRIVHRSVVVGIVCGAIFAGLFAANTALARELADFKVLYVGDERASHYADFLKAHVAEVTVKRIADFKPDDAGPFDVVLLDWPQNFSNREMRERTSPLGPRSKWNKPTVLLGSAGLNLAVAWQVKGGSGCTCLDPLAYDLRQHEIFSQPFAIDRGAMISIPTPEDFRGELSESEIRVLPLVDDWKAARSAGWCTYTTHFDSHPDIEVFAGGVNHKTPTAAGLWRQGNLLHFGFQESPAHMNESGQRLLLNSIAYISRFSQDRPIAVTPSPFAEKVPAFRTSPARYLEHDEVDLEVPQDLVSAELWKQLSDGADREQMAARARELAPFLYPDEEKRLEIDQDLKGLGIPFDSPDFFERTLSDLGGGDAERSRALRLLRRYVLDGPTQADATTWNAWWEENGPYLFASDHADYRWYVDPLARERKVPQTELRGPRRGDAPQTGVAAAK